MRAVSNSNQPEFFHEVKHVGQLPSIVVEELGGIVDPGQPFNSTDVVDPKLPMRQLVVAAISENHCIVAYWHGGIALGLETTIFEYSKGNAIHEWRTFGGGLNFQDLKDTVEAGKMLHFQQIR